MLGVTVDGDAIEDIVDRLQKRRKAAFLITNFKKYGPLSETARSFMDVCKLCAKRVPALVSSVHRFAMDRKYS